VWLLFEYSFNKYGSKFENEKLLCMVTRCKIRSFFFFAGLLPCTLATAQQSKALAIDAYISPLVKANQFSGIVMASYKGKFIYEKSFGYAVAEFDLPNQLNTRFGVASVTKSMTLIIALKLAQEGKLQFSDKLSRWVADFPNGNEITIEMLIKHQSGLPHRITKPEEEALPYTPADMLEKAKHAELIFPPGIKEAYSSLGYSVLARILELASGKTYDELLRQYVFELAGMKNSMDYSADTVMPFRAHEYLLEPQKMIPAPLKDYSFIVGAGSVYSTAEDVFRFADAVANGKYGQEVKQALTDSTGRYRDNGSTNGFRCFILFDPKKHFGFVVISNLHSGANDLLVRDLPKILEDQPITTFKLPHLNLVHLPSNKLQEYVGAYKFPNFTNHITIIGDQLISGDSKIFAIGEDHFYRLADYANLAFTRNPSGQIEGLKWEALTGTFVGTRQ
jgi:CubicO group peptidase (beta-lactamase class C family)